MNAPLAIPPTWTTGSTAVIKTGTWRAAIASQCARRPARMVAIMSDSSSAAEERSQGSYPKPGRPS